jgi:squalene-hopene/tetraprenyl-beta-curcumene cyclase
MAFACGTRKNRENALDPSVPMGYLLVSDSVSFTWKGVRIMNARFATGCLLFFSCAVPAVAASWDATAAAGYLDGRETWWQSWPKSERDHETHCVSCHSVLPYAIGRPAARAALKDAQFAAPEQTMLAYIEKRVGLWKETEPFYKKESGETKPEESRGTEAVLNAFILASYDAPTGHMRDVTRTAFANAWALQLDSGTWNWLNFHLGPWETDNSQYWGTTLMAMAVAMAPEGYRESPQIQAGLAKMRAWLKEGYASQPLFNRAFVLWASASLPGLLSPAEQKKVSDELGSKQREDGGWNLASLGAWPRRDNTTQETRTDGYATAVAVLALKAGGMPSSASPLEKGRTWLLRSQEKDGSWSAWSLNKERDQASDIGRFMRDAATGYAALALESTSTQEAGN